MRAARLTRWLFWLAGPLLALLLVQTALAQHHKKHKRKPRPTPPAQVEPAPAPPSAGAAADGGADQADAGTAGQQAAPSAEGEAASADRGAGTPSEGSSPAGEGGQGSSSADPFAEAFGGPDVGPLRDEFNAVMDDLVQTRSRLAVLGRALFKTRIRIRLGDRAAGRQSLAHLSVELDGAAVYRHDGDVGDEPQQLFEGFAAPGPHLITIVAEQRSRDNEDYRYQLRDTYRFEVVRGKLNDVFLLLDDDSKIAKDFPKRGDGQYEVSTRFRVTTRELDGR